MPKRLQEMLFDHICPFYFVSGPKIVAYGRTINDPRGFDGSSIRTSPIERVWLEDGKMFIETENTLYFVTLAPENNI